MQFEHGLGIDALLSKKATFSYKKLNKGDCLHLEPRYLTLNHFRQMMTIQMSTYTTLCNIKIAKLL